MTREQSSPKNTTYWPLVWLDLDSLIQCPGEYRGVGGGGNSHVKRSGMLAVWLEGVKHGFWSHLGCLRRNPTIFSHHLAGGWRAGNLN